MSERKSARLVAALRLVDNWRRAMQGVTPGKWRHYRARLRPQRGPVINEVQCDERSPVVLWSGFDDVRRPEREAARNAAWIARCSPAGISALLNTIEDQADEIRRLRAATAAPIEGRANG